MLCYINHTDKIQAVLNIVRLLRNSDYVVIEGSRTAISFTTCKLSKKLHLCPFFVSETFVPEMPDRLVVRPVTTSLMVQWATGKASRMFTDNCLMLIPSSTPSRIYVSKVFLLQEKASYC